MDIAKGKYWDLAVNPIIIDNCSCEVGDHCWAKQMINRGLPNIKPGWFPKRLDKISLRGAPKVYAVNWLCDIAHESVEEWMAAYVITALSQINKYRMNNELQPHTFLILTKFPDNLFKILSTCGKIHHSGIWIGTSITGANEGLDIKRVRELHKFAIAGFKTWWSIEPTLGRLSPLVIEFLYGYTTEADHSPNCDGSCRDCPIAVQVQTIQPDQVIAGAETGSGARPCNPDWLRRIRDYCASAGVSFFLKQVDAKRNRVLDERTHDELEWNK